MASDDRTAAIDSSAQGPKRVRTDAGEAEAHDLEQQIAADKYLAAKAASKNGGNRGLRFNQLIPPGAF